jgi:spore maturation protein CgeB
MQIRLTLVGAWASYSVRDVELGYLNALRRAGHDVYHYRLSDRLTKATQDLNRLYRKNMSIMTKPGNPDFAYHAGKELIERALFHRSDWILVIGGALFHPHVITLLRNCGPTPDRKFKFGCLLTESPYEDGEQANLVPWFDVCWTNERTSVPYLRGYNERVNYLPHAYDPNNHHIASPIEDESAVPWFTAKGRSCMAIVKDLPQHDVVFVGTGFWDRQEILKAVDWTGIDLGLYGAWPLARGKLRQHIKGGILDNITTATLYRRAKIGLNLYRNSVTMAKGPGTVDGAESLNPRALELAACGAFQISDYRPEVREAFGDSVPTFETPGQLQGLVRTALDAGEAWRRERSDAARLAVVDWNYDRRAQQIIADMQRYEGEVGD